jgi:hypothetical protein
METTLETAAYIWMAYCAVSHVQIEAKKNGEDSSFKSKKIRYIFQVLIYWVATAAFII